jgi:hypothetical protein
MEQILRPSFSPALSWLSHAKAKGWLIDVFIDELDLAALGFEGMLPATMGRPAYHPATLLKIYLYGYDLADRPPDAGFQDNRRLQSARSADSSGAVPSAQSVHSGCRCG